MVKQILLLSHSRTGCNLLQRMLSQQPNVTYLSHPFRFVRPAQVQSLSEPLDAEPSAETRSPLFEAWEKAFVEWENAIKEVHSAQNQTLFVHTHPMFLLAPSIAFQYASTGKITNYQHDWCLREDQKNTNITVLPDDFYLQADTVPVFTIRHPGLMTPSVHRATQVFEPHASKSCNICSHNLGWSRMLYDWYVENGVDPIIVDADDFMTSQDFMRELCEKIGLDPESVIFKWPSLTEEQLRMQIDMPGAAELMKTLYTSEGVVPGHDARGLEMGVEEGKWEQEFGGETAEFLKEMVELAMPHYLYLRERRLRLQT